MEIIADTIAEAWEKGLCAIVKHYRRTGETVITERDTSSIEIENMVFSIKHPLAEPRCSKLHPNPAYLEAYASRTLDFKYQKNVYARMVDTEYGDANIDQLAHAVELLKTNWYTSKAIITIWDPYVDEGSDHPPCTCLVQFYIRNQKLCMTSYFRSNDAWLCSHGDMIALTNLMKQVADQLGIEVGTYTHIACCFHIYEYDITAALEVFGD
jgi:thymidylate synthase